MSEGETSGEEELAGGGAEVAFSTPLPLLLRIQRGALYSLNDSTSPIIHSLESTVSLQEGFEVVEVEAEAEEEQEEVSLLRFLMRRDPYLLLV